jgi:hypothetical protein
MMARPRRRRLHEPSSRALVVAALALLVGVAQSSEQQQPATSGAIIATDPKAQKYRALDKPQEADELLIGWLGESYQPPPSGGGGGAGGRNGNGGNGAPSSAKRRPPPRVLSWDPRIMHFPGFLTDDECDELVRLAEPKLKRSGVVDSATGKSKLDDVRSSSGQFFSRGEHEVVARVERRVAQWTHLPVEFGEGMQVLKYQDGQEYRPHSDYFTHPQKDANGGNRIATVLMYLTTPDKGGEFFCCVFLFVRLLCHREGAPFQIYTHRARSWSIQREQRIRRGRGAISLSRARRRRFFPPFPSCSHLYSVSPPIPPRKHTTNQPTRHRRFRRNRLPARESSCLAIERPFLLRLRRPRPGRQGAQGRRRPLLEHQARRPLRPRVAPRWLSCRSRRQVRGHQMDPRRPFRRGV